MPASLKGLSAAELRTIVRSRSTHRARSRLRFAIFKEHTDVDAWYEVRVHLRVCFRSVARLCGARLTHMCRHTSAPPASPFATSSTCWPMLPERAALLPPSLYPPSPSLCRRCTCSRTCWTRG